MSLSSLIPCLAFATKHSLALCFLFLSVQRSVDDNLDKEPVAAATAAEITAKRRCLIQQLSIDIPSNSPAPPKPKSLLVQAATTETNANSPGPIKESRSPALTLPSQTIALQTPSLIGGSSLASPTDDSINGSTMASPNGDRGVVDGTLLDRSNRRSFQSGTVDLLAMTSAADATNAPGHRRGSSGAFKPVGPKDAPPPPPANPLVTSGHKKRKKKIYRVESTVLQPGVEFSVSDSTQFRFVGGASALVTFMCVLCTLRTQIS
jgi:hypothetical protein